MDHLTKEEELVTKEFLRIVNDLRIKHDASPMSLNTALKFLMARKFDLDRSLALYDAHESTRFREGLTNFDPDKEPLKSELESGKFTVLPKRDANGAAIAMFTACKHLPNVTSHQITLQGVVYQLDIALEDIETQRSGIVFIYNMFNSRYANFDYELSQKILGLLKGAYPARLKKVLIVTAPLWFKAPFRILRLFVREKLRDRVFMINIPQLSDHIPLSSLPIELGGQLAVDHLAWLNHCHAIRPKIINELYDLASQNYPLCSTNALHNGLIQSVNCTNTLSKSDSNELNSNTSDDDDKLRSSWLGDSPTKDSHHNSNKDDVNNRRERNSVNKPKPENIVMPNNNQNINNDDNSDSKAYDDSSVKSKGMTLEEFIQYLKVKGRKGLTEEYNEIKMKIPDGTFDNSRLRPNQGKNRYTDVLCYDHSRVRLNTIDDDVNSDYINANFVDGYKQKNAFISTQGPLPKTFPDFWRMIWEQQVLLIVMTTRTVERCKAKCGQYWPLEVNSSVEYGPYRVTNNDVQYFTDFNITRLTLVNLESDQTRKVTHMQFLSWPDYGVPHSAYAMLHFRNKVKEEQAKGVSELGESWTGHPLGPPIVVHCSAGIGRTGTFITLDVSINKLEDTGMINIREIVERIRSQRAHSIQMPDQYVFCYLALLEYALSRGLLENVDIAGFEESESD